MARGRLVPPNLDDRTWQDIVDQARALIPSFAPEWTDHNPTDLGITLIELFAWMVEGMTYRLNRVPEKNYVEFLNLLGITRDPATPAATLLAYRLAGGMLPTIVPKGAQASTAQTATEAPVVFETDADLRVLPVNLTTALEISTFIVTRYSNVTAKLTGPPLTGRSLGIFPGKSTMICLGFDAPTTELMPFLLRLSKPARKNDLQMSWRYSRAALPPASWPIVPVAGINDGTEVLQRNGVISLSVPNDWGEQNPKDWPYTSWTPADKVDQGRFWLGLRLSNLLATVLELGLEYILFNSVPATNALTVTQPELLGTSDGKPFQFFELRQRPLFKRPQALDPYDHLAVEVREPLGGGVFGPWTQWQRTEDFPQGAGTFYRLNPVTGTIYFGNHHPTTAPGGHGSIPPLGSEIRAVTYRYVAGDAKGNVPANTITLVRTPVPGIIGVLNPGPAGGGSDEEAMEDTKRRGPEVLKNRYRAVTVEDLEYLAQEATTDVKKVRALPPRLFTTYDPLPAGVSVGDPWTYGGLNRDVGNVHVLVIPDAPLSLPSPMPAQELLEEVQNYLDTRRPVTTVLHVTHPRYLPVRVWLDFRVWRQAVDSGLVPDPVTSNQVRDDLTAKIRQFLHPLKGGLEGLGWEMGQDLTIASLFDFLKPDSELGFIADLKIEAQTPLYTPTDRPFPVAVPGVWLQVLDYEIICSAPSHNVTVTKV